MSFEQAMQRPSNFHELSSQERWDIDKRLGILDWDGDMTPEQKKKMRKHHGLKDPTKEEK